MLKEILKKSTVQYFDKQNIECWTVLCHAFNEIRNSESNKIKIIRVFFYHNLFLII